MKSITVPLFRLIPVFAIGLLFTAEAAINISTLSDLEKIGSDPNYPLNGDYLLTADIDASETHTRPEGFTPIGNYTTPFTGIFDGNGNIVRGLYINRPDQNNIGLFGVVSNGGTIRNIGVQSDTIVGKDYVGGVVGWVGNQGSLSNCFSNCHLKGRYYVGGLFGGSAGGTVENCYSFGALNAASTAGGLVGKNQSVFQNCFAVVRVTASSLAGGLCGQDLGGQMNSCYWDASVSNQAGSAGGQGRSTEELFMQSTYSGWNFESIWGIQDNTFYPFLKEFSSYSLSYSASFDGTVTGHRLQVVNKGASFPVVAVADTHYHFVKWSDDVSASSRSDHHTSSSISVTALFAIDQFTLHYGAENGGRIVGDTVQVVQYGASGSTVRAVADTGFFFVKWSDGVVAEERRDSNVVEGRHASVVWGRYIDTITDLQKIGSDSSYPLDGFYRLEKSIDASQTRNWDNGQGFKPIGSGILRFAGDFDGMGNSITGLHINRPDSNYVGLFCIVDNKGSVRNLKVSVDSVNGKMFVGALAGCNYGLLSGCQISGTLKGQMVTGGLVGSSDGVIENSSARVRVEGGNTTGGLAGSSSGVIQSSFSFSDVSGMDYVGTLCGSAGDSIIQCYSSGTVSGNAFVGGLVGTVNNGFFSNCYSVSNVNASFSAGGFVGSAQQSTFKNLYCRGTVLAYSAVGGLVGASNTSTFESCFWDLQGTGQQASQGGIGKTPVELKMQSTFVNWNFADAWGISENNYFPYLKYFPVCTLSYSCGAFGSVLGEVKQIVNYGVADVVVAVPDPNFHFVKWSDGVTDSLRQDLTVSGDVTVTAQFAAEVFSLHYSTDDCGSIEGDTLQRVAFGENGQTVIAKASEGFFFVSWSDGVRSAERKDSSVTSDLSLSIIWGRQISSMEQLALIGTDSLYPLDSYYELSNDIDASGFRDAIDELGSGWRPIGSPASPFEGTFYGNGFHVSGLYINRPTEDYCGLFGVVNENANVIGVMIEADSIIGRDYVGALAGYVSGHIDSCGFLDGVISGQNRVGGLIGIASGARIFGCFSKGTLSAQSRAGGLVGELAGSNLSNSHSSSLVSASSFAGGVVGSSEGDSISFCYASGEVEGSFITGGLAGNLGGSFVANCYSVADVNGKDYVGGFIGNHAGVVQKSYSAGRVAGIGHIGGFVGYSWETALTSACFWDSLSSQQQISAAGQALSSGQMKNQVAFSSEGWDFDLDWGINEGNYYPYLRKFPSFTCTYLSNGNGSLMGSCVQTVNPCGSKPILAMPDSGYHLEAWSDGLVETHRCDREISSDLTVTAEFKINVYTLSYHSGENGYLEGDSLQQVNHFSNGSEVWAIPLDGFQFVGWSDNSLENPRRDLHVTGDLEVTALFGISTHVNNDRPIIVSVAGGLARPLEMRLRVAPNPVENSGKATFFIEGGRVADGTVRIYDAMGNLCRNLNVDGIVSGKNYRIATWDLVDNNGRRVSSGTYKVLGELRGLDGRKILVKGLVGVRR